MIFLVTLVSLLPISHTTLLVKLSLAESDNAYVFNGRYLYKKSRPDLIANVFESWIHIAIEFITNVYIFGQNYLSKSLP